MFSLLTNKYYALFFIILFCIVLFLPASYLRPFHSRGEPREALIAKNMLATGNWILPERSAGEFATKPPMLHWLITLASIPKGEVSEFTARIPSVLLATLAMALLYLMLHSSWGKESAFLAIIILGTSFVWFRCATAARVDMALSAFVMLALVSFYWLERCHFRSILYFILCVGSLSASVLTKGPAFVALPSIIMLLYSLSRGKSIRISLGTVALLSLSASIIAAVWYWLAYLQGGQKFLEIIYNENLARFSGHMSQGRDPHEHSFFYLLGTFVLGMAPWSIIILILSIHPFWNQRKMAVGKLDYSTFKILPSELQLALITCLCFVAFYAIPDSKRAEYLIPSYPFAAIIFTYFLKNKFNHSHLKAVFKHIEFGLLSISTLILMALFILPFIKPISISPTLNFIHTIINENFVLIFTSQLAIWGLLLVHMLWPKVKGFSLHPGTNFGLIYVVILIISASLTALPFARNLSALQFKASIDDVSNLKLPILLAETEYGLIFYLDNKIKKIDETFINWPAEFYLIANDNFWISANGTNLVANAEKTMPIKKHALEKPKNTYSLSLVTLSKVYIEF